MMQKSHNDYFLTQRADAVARHGKSVNHCLPFAALRRGVRSREGGASPTVSGIQRAIRIIINSALTTPDLVERTASSETMDLYRNDSSHVPVQVARQDNKDDDLMRRPTKTMKC